MPSRAAWSGPTSSTAVPVKVFMTNLGVGRSRGEGGKHVRRPRALALCWRILRPRGRELQEPISKGVGSCYRYSCVHGYSDHGGYRGHALGLVQSSEFIRAYNSKPTKFVQAATPSTPESQLAQTCTEQSLAPWVKRGVINATSRGGIAAWGRYFSAVPATLPTIAPPLRIGWFLHHINQLELYGCQPLVTG